MSDLSVGWSVYNTLDHQPQNYLPKSFGNCATVTCYTCAHVTIHAECVHTTELANHVSRGMPMVVNPIYETGAIYEEIPDPSIYKSQHALPTPMEKEEGYVSISSTAATNTTFSEKLVSDQFHVASYILSVFTTLLIESYWFMGKAYYLSFSNMTSICILPKQTHCFGKIYTFTFRA